MQLVYELCCVKINKIQVRPVGKTSNQSTSEKMGKTNVIHTHVEGAGDLSSFKLQPHQAACLGIVSHPQANAQDHTSCKLQQQSTKTLIRGFLSFYYSGN